ncbi:hypothetical protein [Streptomyces sp. ICC4]|nr:hypothetical protein [Streptomyces sp. ICC4]
MDEDVDGDADADGVTITDNNTERTTGIKKIPPVLSRSLIHI